jgi:2-oxoglutarate/2-oxoacid ferredoxin oxidoreductase subunit beta
MSNQLLAKDFKSDVKPIWCPRCGDFGFLSALLKSFEKLQIKPYETVVVSGIGCAGRIPAFMNTYGFHGAHGRALPLATGVKLANPNLNVMAIGGDGDGFAIGMGHFPHAIRRNVDMLYACLDNSIYGLTKGQSSPTTQSFHLTKTNPYDIDSDPIDPVCIALASGATFVARIFSGKMQEMLQILPIALQHKGFAFVHALSPCSTFYDTFGHYKEKTQSLPDSYKPDNRMKALEYGSSTGPIYTGVLYQQAKETLDEKVEKLILEKKQENINVVELARSWNSR